jgi:hypothetical protein
VSSKAVAFFVACATLGGGCSANVVVDGAKGNGGGTTTSGTTTSGTTTTGVTTGTPMCQHCTAIGCFDVNVDPFSCGACGHVCNPDEYCDQGTCVPTSCGNAAGCTSSQICCGGTCCPPGQLCCASASGPTCMTPILGTCPAAVSNCQCH